MAKIKLTSEGWDELMKKLDELGGGSAMKKGAEAGMVASKEYITPLLKQAVTGGSLPAGGKYSKGGVLEALNEDMSVKWSGLTGSMDVGFNLKKDGLVSIYLMYGTPRMRPAKGLKSAIYGAKTKREISRLQSEAIGEVIKKIMEG